MSTSGNTHSVLFAVTGRGSYLRSACSSLLPTSQRFEIQLTLVAVKLLSIHACEPILLDYLATNLLTRSLLNACASTPIGVFGAPACAAESPSGTLSPTRASF